MWESVCCRLSQGLSITPFTQSWKFPLLWYVGLPWSYCESAEVSIVAYSEVSHCFSAEAFAFFSSIVCLCEQPGEDKWLPRIQPPTLNQRCYIIPTITHWDEVWAWRPENTGLCTFQTYSVCLWNYTELLQFLFSTKFFFTFSYLFHFYFPVTTVFNHILGSSQSAYRVGLPPHVYTCRSQLYLQLWAAGHCIAPHSQSDANSAACVCAIVMTKPWWRWWICETHDEL